MAAPSAITLPAASQAAPAVVWNGDPVQYVSSGLADVEGTVTAAMVNGQTCDGATLATNDVVLVLTASPYKHSGIYVVGAVAGARHADADAPGDFVANMRVPIVAGAYIGRNARYAGPSSPTLGSTGLPFVFDPQIITPPA